MAQCFLTFAGFLVLLHQKNRKKGLATLKGVGVCLFFLFFDGDEEEEVSHIFEKRRVQAEPFPLTAKSMEQVFHFLSQTHKKHFYARSNHITPCHHRSLGQAFVYTHSHSGHNVGNFPGFSQSSLSHVDSKYMSPSIPLLPYVSYPLLPSPFQLLRLPPFHCSLSPP